MSPSETALITQVLISSGFLFGIAYLGNRLSFSNRFVNALITALIFAVFYAGLAYTVDKTVLPPEMKETTKDTWLQMILMAAGLVFVLDLVANFISFNNQFVSALTTAVLFVVLFGALLYSTGGIPTATVPTTAPPAAPTVSPQPTP
jgi:uncharacterized protein involved in cysteine biosynthesis